MRLKTIAAALMILSGCVSAEQDVSRARAICTGAGWIDGTAEYEACLGRQMEAIQGSRMGAGQAIGAALQSYGSATTAAARPHSPQYRPPVQCTSYQAGVNVNTTCY